MNDERKPNFPHLVTPSELSAILQIPQKTLYYWVSCKKVPYLKIGRHLRFDAAAVLQHFDRQSGGELVINRRKRGSLTCRSGNFAHPKGAGNGSH